MMEIRVYIDFLSVNASPPLLQKVGRLLSFGCADVGEYSFSM